MNKMKKLLLLIIVVCVGLFYSTWAYSNSKEIIIFFNQSSLNKAYDYSKVIPLIWSKIFTKTINTSYKITLIGYDEKIYVYDNQMQEEINYDVSLLEKILKRSKNIKSTSAVASAVADLERPFKYLLEKQNLQSVELVLFIFDDLLKIFDKKDGLLSERIKSDYRYKDLIIQYDKLSKLGKNLDFIYENVGTFINNRNVSYINEKASQLKNIFKNKLFLWDVTYKSAYLKNLAITSGAHYLTSSNSDLGMTDEVEKEIENVLQQVPLFKELKSLPVAKPEKSEKAKTFLKISKDTTVNINSQNKIFDWRNAMLFLLFSIIIVISLYFIYVYNKLLKQKMLLQQEMEDEKDILLQKKKSLDAEILTIKENLKIEYLKYKEKLDLEFKEILKKGSLTDVAVYQVAICRELDEYKEIKKIEMDKELKAEKEKAMRFIEEWKESQKEVLLYEMRKSA
ncbi:MAG: hypothetical protein HQK49_04685 [Oligoflexia bacterium]|nr:hypothetical protein [Oligoflexia bacterium]